MFYENLKIECDKQGLKISNVVVECGGAVGSIGGWKKGAIPNGSIVIALALRLNVTTDYLLMGKKKDLFDLDEYQKEAVILLSEMNIDEKKLVLERAKTIIDLKNINKRNSDEENNAEKDAG